MNFVTAVKDGDIFPYLKTWYLSMKLISEMNCEIYKHQKKTLY